MESHDGENKEDPVYLRVTDYSGDCLLGVHYYTSTVRLYKHTTIVRTYYITVVRREIT